MLEHGVNSLLQDLGLEDFFLVQIDLTINIICPTAILADKPASSKN